MSPPKDVEEEERPPPSRSTHHLDSHEMDRAIVELREDLEHERDRRFALADLVREAVHASAPIRSSIVAP